MYQPFCRVKMAWTWPPSSKEELSGWKVMAIQSQEDQVSKGGVLLFLDSHVFRSLSRRGDRWACAACMRLGSSCEGPGENMMDGLDLPSHFILSK